MLPTKLAFIDLETTGTSAKYGRIIEIGIVRVEENEVVQTYHTLLNPETSLPAEIEMITGISMKDLEGQPLFRHVHKEILEILSDCVFVAHNVRFDYSFLKYEFLRENIDFSAKHFCTVKLSRALYPTATHHNLDAIIQRFGFSCEQRHRAFDDAKILWEFYQQIQKDFSSELLEKALDIALRRPNIPTKLKHDELDSLPDQPGVYIFYGPNPDQTILSQPTSTVFKKPPASHIPLYIGKSINIHDRVLSHFSGDIHSPIEMKIAQQIEKIETITTAGELGALFLESRLIKEKMPLYNRMLRNKREVVGLKKTTNKEGYETIHMDTFQSDISADDLDSFLGFFKSKKQAKDFLTSIAKEYGLCEKLLGLEKTHSACFGYRLKRCKGACINEEKPLFYNLRFTTAFYKTKIRPWPFNGPIIIEEKNDFLRKTDYFVIDKWCYIGTITSTQEGTEDVQMESQYTFDLDMYKILYKYLNKSDNLQKIRNYNNYYKKNRINCTKYYQ